MWMKCTKKVYQHLLNFSEQANYQAPFITTDTL